MPLSHTDLTETRSARALAKLYGRSLIGRHVLSLITRLEGGQLHSATLRRLLESHHGVIVGAHSYGSLLIPGRADPDTFIGRYVSVGPDVRRIGAAHPLNSLTLHPYWYNAQLGHTSIEFDVKRTALVIESDSWIGAGALILPGCRRIGFGAVVGAGAVVTHDVADFEVVTGVPARPQRLRLSGRERAELLERRPWDLSPEDATAVHREIRGAS